MTGLIGGAVPDRYAAAASDRCMPRRLRPTSVGWYFSSHRRWRNLPFERIVPAIDVVDPTMGPDVGTAQGGDSAVSATASAVEAPNTRERSGRRRRRGRSAPHAPRWQPLAAGGDLGTLPSRTQRLQWTGCSLACAARLLERAVHAAQDWGAPAKHPVHPLFYAATMVPGALEALHRNEPR